MDVHQKAQELAEALSSSKEYQRLIAAREQVEKHAAAKIMLRDFQQKQMSLQEKQLKGESVTQSDIEELRKLYEVLNINPYLRELFDAEFGFSSLMLEVQEIVNKKLGLIDLSEEDEEKKSDQLITPPEKKLWIPGN